MSAPTLERPVEEGVDPRIAARRVAVATDRRRSRLRRIAWLLVALSVVVGAWYLTHTSLLDVEVVQVEGAERATPDEIREASGVVPGDPLVWLDDGEVAAAVEAVPWVDSASVRRNVDGTVRVAVVERVPVASAAAPDGSVALLDLTGRVLAVLTPEEVSASHPGLVPIEGIVAPAPGEAVGAPADGALAVVERLGPGLRPRVAAVRVTEVGELELALVPDITVELGDSRELDTKLASLVTTLSQIDQTDLATLSLRVPELATATRRTP